MKQEYWDWLNAVIAFGLMVFVAWALGGDNCGVVVLREVVPC